LVFCDWPDLLRDCATGCTTVFELDEDHVDRPMLKAAVCLLAAAAAAAVKKALGNVKELKYRRKIQKTSV